MIPGGPDLHVKQGSSLRLECQLIASTEAPSFIFWYREGRMINYDDEPGVKVEATKNGSILVVDKVKLSHGANYTCWPSNARPAYIMIHVIEGWLSIFFSFLHISFLFLSRIQDLCTYTYAYKSFAKSFVCFKSTSPPVRLILRLIFVITYLLTVYSSRKNVIFSFFYFCL